ncbi:MAG: hypothetical protein ACHQ2Y_01835 [Candidatus Lutacidiplasmatales archaeon]
MKSVTLGAGAVGIALIMLLSPMAGASAPRVGFKGAVYQVSLSQSNSGCGTIKASYPTWSALTGAAHWKSSAVSKSCSSVYGTVGSSSAASSSGSIEVAAPVKMVSGVGGVNVSWALAVAWAVAAKVGPSGVCPGYSYNYSYYYSYYNSWINYSDSYSYCSVDASLSISASVYLVDLSTSATYYPSNYWSGLNKGFDTYNDTSTTVETWSNSSYWQNNYTSWYTNGYRSGSTGSGTLGASSSPQFFINGTFVGTDKYAIIATFSAYTNSNVNGMKKSMASAMVDFASTGLGADLQAVVW